MKKISTSIVIFIALFFTIPSTTHVLAEELGNQPVKERTGASQDTCTPGSGTVCINNPLGKDMNTPQKFIGRVISGLLGVIGSIALVMFVLGGFKWMTSAGDKNKVASGRDTMLWAVLGLTVVFSSYALVKFVIEKVAG